MTPLFVHRYSLNGKISTNKADVNYLQRAAWKTTTSLNLQNQECTHSNLKFDHIVNANICFLQPAHCKVYQVQADQQQTRDATTSLQTSHLPTHALSWIPCELWWVCVGAGDGIQHETFSPVATWSTNTNCSGTTLWAEYILGHVLKVGITLQRLQRLQMLRKCMFCVGVHAIVLPAHRSNKAFLLQKVNSYGIILSFYKALHWLGCIGQPIIISNTSPRSHE